MKKLYFLPAIIFLAALALFASTAQAAWKPASPDGYASITWAKATGIASFFKPPADNGAIDFITRIYLPQNQIQVILSTSTAVSVNSSINQSIASSTADTSGTPSDVSAFPDLFFGLRAGNLIIRNRPT